MNTLHFKKDSWHYRLATYYGYANESEMQNICDYTHRVMVGFFACLFLSFLIALGLSALVLFFLWLYISSFIAFIEPSILAIVGSTLLGLCVLVSTSMYLEEKIKNWRAKHRSLVEKQNSFVVHAYKSMKEKYCVPIEFD